MLLTHSTRNAKEILKQKLFNGTNSNALRS